MSNNIYQTPSPEIAALPDAAPQSFRLGRFWRRWVAANALGELCGLGLAGLLGFGMMWWLGEPTGTANVLLVAGLLVLLGVGEGVIVGYAQARVLCEALDTLHIRTWIEATALGAFSAWVLGMLPSTIINLRATSASGPPPEISAALQLMLAAAMGAMLGVILAGPQWRVLRRYVVRAGWWLPANALAWAVGMPVIFWGMGVLVTTHSGFAIVLFLALTLLAAGAVVGAVHGVALVWLLSTQSKMLSSN